MECYEPETWDTILNGTHHDGLTAEECEERVGPWNAGPTGEMLDIDQLSENSRVISEAIAEIDPKLYEHEWCFRTAIYEADFDTARKAMRSISFHLDAETNKARTRSKIAQYIKERAPASWTGQEADLEDGPDAPDYRGRLYI